MSFGEVLLFRVRQLFRLPVLFPLELQLALGTLEIVVKLPIVTFEWEMCTVHQTGVRSESLGLQ